VGYKQSFFSELFMSYKKLIVLQGIPFYQNDS
jgi:hypothetical protein